MVPGLLAFTSKSISEEASEYLSQSSKTYVKNQREQHVTLDFPGEKNDRSALCSGPSLARLWLQQWGEAGLCYGSGCECSNTCDRKQYRFIAGRRLIPGQLPLWVPVSSPWGPDWPSSFWIRECGKLPTGSKSFCLEVTSITSAHISVTKISHRAIQLHPGRAVMCLRITDLQCMAPMTSRLLAADTPQSHSKCLKVSR